MRWGASNGECGGGTSPHMAHRAGFPAESRTRSDPGPPVVGFPRRHTGFPSPCALCPRGGPASTISLRRFPLPRDPPARASFAPQISGSYLSIYLGPSLCAFISPCRRRSRPALPASLRVIPRRRRAGTHLLPWESRQLDGAALLQIRLARVGAAVLRTSECV
ncbi:hypothetical protein EXIGLDRAFT_317361 [Exidia glandulosa HHB12029]|uniref:Uncharacterized protein n=1 Tax=Exidia glandulosa HHB12029 TaxID=1314781 RepID=A0A165CWD2_EXIGL|nr:hypothetical protein EXIGLDRAFT_317361 [Exidia glandulosa HHB12029]